MEYCIIKRNLSHLFVDYKKLDIRIKYLANMAYENSNSIILLAISNKTDELFLQLNQKTYSTDSHLIYAFFSSNCLQNKGFYLLIYFFFQIKNPGHIC